MSRPQSRVNSSGGASNLLPATRNKRVSSFLKRQNGFIDQPFGAAPTAGLPQLDHGIEVKGPEGQEVTNSLFAL